MLKNILKLEGAQKLTKNEQKSIAGGGRVCVVNQRCYQICVNNGGGSRACTFKCNFCSS